jgi:hypothetical protein
MINIAYSYELDYLSDGDRRFPGLFVRFASETDAVGFDTDAHLDSGAETSLFDGEITTVLGLDLLSGEERVFHTASGAEIEARLHEVTFFHDDLGEFTMKVAFSTGKIHRNLLGRDFMSLVQIGFRERHLRIHVERE